MCKYRAVTASYMTLVRLNPLTNVIHIYGGRYEVACVAIVDTRTRDGPDKE